MKEKIQSTIHKLLAAAENRGPVDSVRLTQSVLNLTKALTHLDTSETRQEKDSTFKSRVEVELAELSVKVSKLALFTETPKFRTLPITEQTRLEVQLSSMMKYGDVLIQRINANFQ